MDYKAVSGKALKFKGSSSTKSGGIRKKQKKTTLSNVTPIDDVTSANESPARDDAAQSKVKDTRTPAQRKFDDIKRLRESREAEKTASLTHRQRIEAMNTHLSKLSEHNDMPKIGPG